MSVGRAVVDTNVVVLGFDALIAATALANELALFTTNPDDFTGIDGLEVVAVIAPEAG